MIVGVDFDNTLVCYEGLFHAAALEWGIIPSGISPSKGAVREYLRKVQQEHLWTELQGYVYGKRIQEAPLFPGAAEALSSLLLQGVTVIIISHKTRYPYRGREKYDLHKAATDWIEHRLFPLLPHPLEVYFELTKEAKLQRIAASSCTHFVDDLPEFLGERDFPEQTQKILFDPSERFLQEEGFLRVSSWFEAGKLLMGMHEHEKL